MYDAIKAVLPTCKNPSDLRLTLQKFGIEIEYKYKRTAREIEGVSFRYDNINFKGSEVDRKFSFGNLKKAFKENIRILHEQRAKIQEQQKEQEKSLPTTRNFVIKGIELNDEQQKILMDGGYIFLENMTAKDKDGKTLFFAYVFLNDEKNAAHFSNKNPDELIQYGKMEERMPTLISGKRIHRMPNIRSHGATHAY